MLALRMVDDEEGYICKSFIKEWKENWKQGTVLWLLSIVACYAVYLDFQLFEAVEGNPIMFLIIGMVSCFVVVLCLIYAYPLMARYENTLVRTIQNSYRIARKYFGIAVGPAIMIFTIAGISKRIFQEIEKEPGAVIKKSSLPTE